MRNRKELVKRNTFAVTIGLFSSRLFTHSPVPVSISSSHIPTPYTQMDGVKPSLLSYPYTSRIVSLPPKLKSRPVSIPTDASSLDGQNGHPLNAHIL